MSTWTKLRDSVEGFFGGTLWGFLKPFIEGIEKNGSHILIAAAENAVAVGFASPGSGQAKMAAALAAFSAQVVAEGLPYVESQARALIEVALQSAKASVPADTSPTPAPTAA